VAVSTTGASFPTMKEAVVAVADAALGSRAVSRMARRVTLDGRAPASAEAFQERV
jgi:hypothetical protein